MGREINKLTLILIITGFMSSSTATFASSHDAGWTFGNVGFISYQLDAIEPADVDLGAAVGAEDPTLTLQLGRRYQVRIVNYQVHPFEVLAKGPSAGSDTVLLSMGSPVGPFESDPAVAWEDNNSGTVTFTLTYALYKAMNAPNKTPGYRCRPHSTTMRGNFVVRGVPVDGPIEKGQISIELEEIASGLAAPLDLKYVPGSTDRLLVLDQAGKANLIVNGALQSEPFIDVTDRLVSPLGIIGSFDEDDFDERGFLGLAFHPGFADPNSAGFQKVYTYTSEPVSGSADFTTDPVLENYNHQSVIAEWLIDADNPNAIDITSRREVLRINQPQFNHDGGTLLFGPDNYLYIALGDGGGGNDTSAGHGPTGNGQNKNTIYASLVRIDPIEPSVTPESIDPVSANGKYRVPADNPFVGTDGLDELYAYGLRNPFKFSFDSETGRLIAADVGQGNIEEIDIIEKGGNYGWNIKEGTFRFNPATGGISDDLSGIDPALIDPVAEYDHDDGISIIGGFVYRGSAIPELQGKYVFGDFSGSFGSPSGRLFYADLDTGLIQELIIGEDDRDLDLYVKGFGLDAEGEIYILVSTALGPYGSSGVALKIVPIQ